MSNSVRKLIIQNLVSSLETIVQTDGFSMTLNPANIARGSIMPQQYPAVSIMVGAERPEDDGSPFDLASWRMSVTLVLWIDGDAKTIADRIEDLLADVRKALEADFSRGGYAITTNDLGASEPTLSEANAQVSVVTVQLEIRYRSQRKEPTILA